jgi:phosphoserine phosphatase RsbU/P
MGATRSAMGRDILTRRERWKAFWGRRTRVGKITLWLLAVIFVCTFALMIHVLPTLDTVLISFAGMALTPLLLILFFRWVTYRLLWKVRNRLILTYVLMGLAPVVMVVILAGIAAYLLAAQYAVNMGNLQLNQGLTRVRDQAGSAAIFGTQAGSRTAPAAKLTASKKGTANSDGTDEEGDTVKTGSEDATPLSLMELKGDAWVPLEGESAKDNQGPLTSGPPPAWLHPGFQGIVEQNNQLYLMAEVSAPRNGKTAVVLASRPLTRPELDVMAKGLGKIILSQGFSHLASDTNDEVDDVGPNLHIKKNGEKNLHIGKDVNVHVVGTDESGKDDEEFHSISSGPLKPATHPYLDPPVVFYAQLPVKAWTSGDEVQAMIAVFSRPSYLYALLFASSVKVGKAVWAIVIGVAIFFALVELFALLMASSLSWTITRSVAELYRGTKAIDAGHLEHRIPVRRKDQLAALANSFNRMAASVSELLVQQREKERLLSELAIAQEVQSTLFPRSPAFMGSLEVHGTCLPARTVGGDYFDFIFGYGPGTADGRKTGHVTLALGDISGKGISAALLMSALHSADRAFSAAVNEEGVPVSPALLLKLLNAHLYRSTQSARYATLFLATYDPATRRLTYSNGGHLPPLVISKDGSVQKLEVGGAVVGLIDGLEYEEATVQLEPGDLFVAYTDGLTEPEKNGEDFGEERLMEFVRARRDEPLTVLATNTLQVVKAWIGEHEQPDDMTVVLARQG